MLITFGIGFLVGVLAIIGLLKMTKREEPTGCIVVFGGFFFLILLALIIPQIF